MKCSELAWQHSLKVIDKIKNHVFNKELMLGILDQKKFIYYIEQDMFYLQNFAKCHAILAAKAPIQYVKCFLRYSESAFVAEQNIVHQFFKEKFHFKKTGLLTPASISYVSYILSTCAIESIELGIASLLPCFWVYHEVGVHMLKHSCSSNPYSRWIETYSSDTFGASVRELIEIFDAVSQAASDEKKQKIIDVFYKSTCLEWHFWNDAYHGAVFDDIY